MKDLIKKYLWDIKIPLGVVIVVCLLSTTTIFLTYPKPPKSLISLHIAGVEKIIQKGTMDEFTREYLLLNVQEYRQIFHVSYGVLDEITEKLFDDTIIKLQAKK